MKTPVTRQSWRSFDRLMQTLHLYLGLFLAPWLLIYATSAFLLNHDDLFRDLFGVVQPGWAVIQELELNREQIPRRDPDATAIALLEQLELTGPYQITKDMGDSNFVVYRFSGSGDYRISWIRSESLAVIEQQKPVSAYAFLHSLHFQVGHGYKHHASDAWALIVDAITISIWLWVISGFYFWIRKPGHHLREAVIVASGTGICMMLAFMLYQ